MRYGEVQRPATAFHGELQCSVTLQRLRDELGEDEGTEPPVSGLSCFLPAAFLPLNMNAVIRALPADTEALGALPQGDSIHRIG